jgi:hypothetical protein
MSVSYVPEMSEKESTKFNIQAQAPQFGKKFIQFGSFFYPLLFFIFLVDRLDGYTVQLFHFMGLLQG